MINRRIDGSLVEKTKEEWALIDKANKPKKTKKEKIHEAKGSAQEQLDYIVKHGVEAYRAEMTRIEGEIK